MIQVRRTEHWRIRRVHLAGACVAAVLAGQPTLASAQDQRHIVSSAMWSRTPLSDSGMTVRLRSAALEYRSYAPVPRIALYEFGYAANNKEHLSLNGYAGLTVTAMSQDSLELPLGRLFFRDAGGGELELVPLATVCRELDSSHAEISATLGRYRCDAIYAVPGTIRTQVGHLMVDYRIRRRDFRLASFDGTIPQALADLDLSVTGPLPAHAVLRAFLVREFPVFEPHLEP